MRIRQTCVYIIAGSVLLSHGLAYADSSGSIMAASGGTDGSGGSMKPQQAQRQQQGIESYSPPSGPKAGGDATLPDPTTNRKGGTTNRKGGIESYSPPSGAKAGRDATLPDPTTNQKGSSGRSGSGAGSKSMKSSGTGSSGVSGGGY
jgi:hypothetical protein